MTKVTTVAPAPLTRDFGTKADKNYKAILATQAQVAEGFLTMGSLLKACRDEKYFTAYGHEKFEHFLGSPELGMSRSMAFGLIQVHELYVLKLDRPQEELVKAGIGKLLDIAPVVEKDPDEWLGKTAMSRSDLKLEVAEALGKEPKALGPAPDVSLSPDLTEMVPEGDYYGWVKRQACIICGKPADPHHFPVTKGSGGAGVAEHVIPLCRECHEEAHADPIEWMATYKAKWGNYFFNLILMLWPKAEPKAEPKVIETTCVPVIDVVVPPIAEEPKAMLPKPEKKSRKERREARAEHKKLIVSVSTGTIGSITGIGAKGEEELSADADKTPEELLKEAEPKVMEGFGKFARCYKCKSMMPEEDLEGGLCASCRG
jgi:hypothetical protein